LVAAVIFRTISGVASGTIGMMRIGANDGLGAKPEAADLKEGLPLSADSGHFDALRRDTPGGRGSVAQTKSLALPVSRRGR
jgi:hypothetical protein